FKAKSGVMPTISTYESNATMFAKLNSPAGRGFDMAIPSQGWLPQMIKRGMLEKLDHSRIDLSALMPQLLNRGFDPGNQYSVPKDYGFSGLIYDPEAVGMEIKTWEDFFTVGVKPGVSGKIRMSESSWELVGMQLWLEGLDWNKATPEQIRKAGKRLIEFAPHVRSFGGFDPLVNGSIVMSQNDQGVARAAILQNPKLKWVMPEPMSEIWVDTYVIMKGAPHKKLAYDFIDWQLEPARQIASTEFIGYPAALKDLESKLDPKTKALDVMFGGKDVDFSKLTSFIVNPKTIGVYNEIQSQILAAAG
ncbi:spermidine/putrescine ABC transporter substrate-binding protein, partial [Thioclava sp. BHET1]